jgi:hypothetical protein
MADVFDIIRRSSLLMTGDAEYYDNKLRILDQEEVPREFIPKSERDRDESQQLEALLISGCIFLQLTRGLKSTEVNPQEREDTILRIVISIDSYLRGSNQFYQLNFPQKPWVILLRKFNCYSESLSISYDRLGKSIAMKNLAAIYHYFLVAPGETSLESFSKLQQEHYDIYQVSKVYSLINDVIMYQKSRLNIH